MDFATNIDGNGTGFPQRARGPQLKYSDLRRADSIHDFRPYMSFTGFTFYIAARCGFTTVR